MKRVISIVLILGIGLFLIQPVKAGDWDDTDKTAFAAYVACHFVDYMQTRRIIEHDMELNPIIEDLAEEMGKTGVTLYFAGTTALTYILADMVFKKHRKMFLGFMGGTSASTVIWNLRMGYRW